jgi:hypothetical protein
MPMTDTEAKAALRSWSLVTRMWSGGDYVYWLRAQPTDPAEAARAPRLSVPGSREFQTQPDGLWITLGVETTAAEVGQARFADCVVVEACGTAQNLNDKRARYSARTTALVVEVRQPWLNTAVPRQGGGTKHRRVLLRAELPAHGEVLLPVRHLRVLYALDDRGASSLYARATTSMVMEAHEYVLPQRLLGQFNAQKTQEFLKRLAPRRQYV